MSGYPTHAKPEVVFFSGAIPVRFFPGGRGGGGCSPNQPTNQPTSGHVLGIIQTCFGHYPEMFWASPGHVLGIIRTWFGHHPEMFSASFGDVLGIIWTNLDKVLNPKMFKNQKS